MSLITCMSRSAQTRAMFGYSARSILSAIAPPFLYGDESVSLCVHDSSLPHIVRREFGFRGADRIARVMDSLDPNHGNRDFLQATIPILEEMDGNYFDIVQDRRITILRMRVVGYTIQIFEHHPAATIPNLDRVCSRGHHSPHLSGMVATTT